MQDYWLIHTRAQKHQFYSFFGNDGARDNCPIQKVQKLTLDSENEDNILPDINEPEKHVQEYQQVHKDGLFRLESQRKKSNIEINFSTRNNYMRSKKGPKEETNDLAVNYCSLLRGTFNQFKLFQYPEIEELDVLKQFEESKNSLESLRKLFGVEETQIPSINQQESPEKKAHRKVNCRCDKIRRYILKKLSQGNMTKNILQSRRMNFENKLKMLKFLNVIEKGCINPQKLDKWKS